MCLIFLAINNHPKYKLIVAANRDEFYSRKTAQADFWQDHPEILGGRDLEAGGSWMAINKKGKIAMVTNYRDLRNLKSDAPSRGHLVSDFLISEREANSYLKQIEPHGDRYNGFNLIVGDVDRLHYLSNYDTGIKSLEQGTYGLSNGLLDSYWPKVQQGKQQFSAILQKDINPDLLFELLQDEKRAPDNELPDTGLDIERERAVSSMFIKTPGYGTRCSTTVLIDHHNRVEFTERVYNLETFNYSQNTFEFQIGN